MAGMFPVDIGPQYEGQVIRKKDFYAEFGGPDVKAKFELVTMKKPEEVENEKVTVIGPDLDGLQEGGSYPLGILIEVAGANLEKDMEPVIERRMHLYGNYVDGLYHMNQRNDIWIRIHKDAQKKGLNLKEIGKILIFLYTSELPVIEKIQVTFITDPARVEEELAKALVIYKDRDERARGLKEEAVTEFYGCVLCQSFAPTHVCIVGPERISNCGAITWFDGRAAAKMDPEGPIFAIEKGEIIDKVRGEYSGPNQVEGVRSMGKYDRVYLHSAFEHPHTSCGCFQAITFYIPEVDAFGIVNREYAGQTPAGMPFSTMAGETSGGLQVEGRLGMALEYIRSAKFIQAEGGLKRIVWMPKEVKEHFKDAIPADLFDKIATEENATTAADLQAFLEKVGHPWVKGEVELPVEWKNQAAEEG
jgi:acetyl-CoA decarbonylase/synthase complex subunit beta